MKLVKDLNGTDQKAKALASYELHCMGIGHDYPVS